MVMEFLPTDKPLLHNLNNKGPVEVFELFFDDRVERSIISPIIML